MAIKLMIPGEKPRPQKQPRQPGASVEVLLRAVLRRLDKKPEERKLEHMIVYTGLAVLTILSIVNTILLLTKGTN